MGEPINPAPQNELTDFIAQQRAPLMAGPEWSALQALDALRTEFDGLLGVLNLAEQREYVSLQRAWIDAQHTLERDIRQFTVAFEEHAMASLRSELKALTGQDIDPTVAKIHTRYLKPSGRVRREFKGDEILVSHVTLWDAACMNYDGLTGWSYPGRTGLADASYLDQGVNATASDFIALVRRLDLGGQLRDHLDQALQANASLGSGIMRLANAEFAFALIDALRDTKASRVDRDKYQQVKRALAGEARWEHVEEMLLFVPHGTDNVSWLPQSIGFVGQYVGKPPGDSLSIPHIVFSVSGCKGAFSFIPNRPGGSLRHHDSHREACEVFHAQFHSAYREGQTGWLYQIMCLSDCARLKQIAQTAQPRRDLEGLEKLVDWLARAIPKVDIVDKVGYVRNAVQKVPPVSLNDFYLKRSRANLQELAHQTPGFMSTMLELFQTLISEILDVLLIPVPGALKGLGRVRAFAMFVAMEQALVEGGQRALLGEPVELVQGFADLADLLISGRLHTRLARSVQRRHQHLYQRLSRQHGAGPEHRQLTSPQVLERMLGSQDVPLRDIEVVLETSATSVQTLSQVWEGAPASASLVDAVHRLRADRLIDWVATADPERPAPIDALDVMAPLLTQLQGWPVETCLSIENHQGLEVRRYSKQATRATTAVVTLTALENHAFAYATPRRFTAHPAQAIVALLPTLVSGGVQVLCQQLATKARALRIDLFDALTRFAQTRRADAAGASASVLSLLPERVNLDQPVPAVIAQLRTLHPELSLARLLEVLREHPLSAHQQTQLLQSQLQPEALYDALRAARQVARREAIVDGLFHPRRYARQTQDWAAHFAHCVLRDGSAQALLVSPATQAVPYVSQGAQDRSVVVIDQDQGRFSPYYHRESRTGAMLSGANAFYLAIMRQLSDDEQRRLGLDAQHRVADFRNQVARALLRHRAPDGSFYPDRRDIAHYVSHVDTAHIAAEPDALGLYRQGTERYLRLDDAYFKVAEQPWRIVHPSLNDAYSPLLSHNGAGAWRHEWENPLTWDGHKAFQRLGPFARALPADAIEQIQRISGVTADILRRIHTGNERPPVAVLETLERFTLHQRVSSGVDAGRDFFDRVLGEVGNESAEALVGQAGGSRVEQVALIEAKVARDRPHMERLFFKALSPKQAPSSDPLAQVLQRDFPSLTAALAEELVRDITAQERLSLQADRIPLSLMSAVRWRVSAARKIRALQGLYLPAAASEETSRLILHTLPDIDGWPSHLRVEVWERGRLIDRIGPVDAALRRILEPVDVDYQAYILLANGERQPTGRPGAFLAVLLDALPSIERDALHYTHDALRQEIEQRSQHTLSRFDPQRRPWYIPPQRLADGRVGYPLSGGEHWGPVDREQVARLRQLFPTKTDEQAFELLNNLSDSVQEREASINFMFKERAVLNDNLDRWCLLGKPEHLSAQREAAARIRRCWAKEDSIRGIPYELVLDDLALSDLPTLGAYFGHVEVLSLKNNRLQAIPASFLRCFPQVRWAFFNGNHLQRFPVGLTQLGYLSLLNLSNNQLRFRLGDVERLADMTSLVKLDLSVNPLRQGQRLKLHQLKKLRVLNLRNTQIESLPLGATSLRSLERFDLRDNRISVLTSLDLFIFPNVYRAMNLQGNPLSQGSLQVIRRYREVPGQSDIDFGLDTQPTAAPTGSDRWLVVLPFDEVPRYKELWKQLQKRQMAEDFFALLERIAAYPPLVAPGFRALRNDLTYRVWQLIESAIHNEQLAVILFQHRFELNRGVDGWLLSLNALELKFLPIELLARDADGDAAPLLNYFRAMHRFRIIDVIVERSHVTPEPEAQSSIILACRIALAHSLDLPLGFDERLARTMPGPNADFIATTHGFIVAAEADVDWPALFAQEDYWRQFLMRKYHARFDAQLGRYDREMERAQEGVESGEMSEGAYLRRVRQIQVMRTRDEEQLIDQLTREEWTRFVTG
ncbi:hypothetical protein J2Y83_004069 [Pseudomonas marginalis]|uniref:NEL-type E3 ubiquitin ligase domain-containing protein n=1 Tax=Pseudomonas marginalis TaxID=298 RepID=UPI00209D3428|nr:NEL-type E3 ubiquitin ligase domain-containing protein [Pseudomonas marginalis]MCP1508096.1 hypothetical protein [Pseudomonas marginalis]MCP1525600.1 hypothetical protein [Pseudomonas marginalis]MDQ0499086.1 hypothetical protein [Pseudomonas marginalis]